MGIFGWSYPPGAANDPNAPYNQEPGPCEVCGQGEDDCICLECPVCENIGDITCYENHHGMIRSFGQVALLAEAERCWQEENDKYDKYADEYEWENRVNYPVEPEVVDEADRPHTFWNCEKCGAENSCLDGTCQYCE